MTIPIHRHSDARVCGASTVVTGQDFVFANDLLVSVDNDPDSHGAGGLIAAVNQVFINDIMVVNVGDNAVPDLFCPVPPHCNPASASGSPDVFVGD